MAMNWGKENSLETAPANPKGKQYDDCRKSQPVL